MGRCVWLSFPRQGSSCAASLRRVVLRSISDEKSSSLPSFFFEMVLKMFTTFRFHLEIFLKRKS